MISTSDRLKGIELIEEANHAGARRERACKELGISLPALDEERPYRDRQTQQSGLNPLTNLHKKSERIFWKYVPA